MESNPILETSCIICNKNITIGSYFNHLQVHSKHDLITALVNCHKIEEQEFSTESSVVNPSSPKFIDVVDGEISIANNQELINQEENRIGTIKSRTKSKADKLLKYKTSENLTIKKLQENQELENEIIPLSGEPVVLQVDTNGSPLDTESQLIHITPLEAPPFFSSDVREGTDTIQSDQIHTICNLETEEYGTASFDRKKFPPSQGDMKIWMGLNEESETVESLYDSTIEDPFSFDNQPREPPPPQSSTHQSGVNLMTDEEIPPRGEISEYEESNTSSRQSDELNKHGVMNIGSTLGSLFKTGRIRSQLSSPTPDSSSNKEKPVVAPSIKLDSNEQESTSRMGSDISVSDSNLHKCPDPLCTKVGSIFELAQHQQKVHQRSYHTAEASQSSTISDFPIARKSFPHEKKAFSCKYCDFRSFVMKLVHGHVAEAHPGQVTQLEFECPTCGKRFHKKTNLTKHQLIHGVKRFSCHCGKAFTSGFKLMEHSRVHTKEYPFQCLPCSKRFRTPSLLKAHNARAHPQPGDVKPFLPKKLEFFCRICSRILLSKRSYDKHVLLHSERAQKCHICYETFPKKAVLTRHIRLVHDSSYTTKESTNCPVCSKRIHPNSLKTHLRIHNDEKPFACAVCNRTFRTAANLSSHSWSHTGAEKPFKCPHCPKSYLFKKLLDAHLIVHNKRRFHFVCNECGMKFTSKVNLKRHCDEHFSDKKYSCKLCSKKFHRKYYLAEHEKIHTGNKPFTCTICGKGSSTRSNHKAHVKIHDARESSTQEG